MLGLGDDAGGTRQGQQDRRKESGSFLKKRTKKLLSVRT
jgi:hypothetical protein